MAKTKLSSKGQVIIPLAAREAHHWEQGQEFTIVDVGDGILLKPRKPFDETTIDEVAACLEYSGKPKSLEEMEKAIQTAHCKH